ncbi:tissue factor pathway inhibitor [Coregonus clupeaformis]|uniref:tissue factor pathway inhibitor n=1 Tax=Coregonus clupeaformis TaxID=59861 RepID=UPI001BE09254|nr:tissue factor pathway inhibitor [Coregonus clupeaformis]
MKQVWSGGVLFLLLVVLARGQLDEEKQGCAWDVDTDPDQGLDPKSLEAGARHLAHLPEMDCKGCQDACCGDQDCQLALIGTPADGTSECFLVSCMKDGKDVCVLQSDSQFKVYRKKTQPKTKKVEVDSLSEAGVPREVNVTDKCRMPMVVGSCRAAFPKYYYDVTNQTCKLFIYGGCDGNGNNFHTQEECEGACSGVTGTVLLSKASPMQRRMAMTADDQAASPEDPASSNDLLPKMTSDDFIEMCQASPETGPCRASHRHYYFDSSTGTCLPFIYGGCLGNKNNYDTAERCLATCTVTVIPGSKGRKGSDIDKPTDDKSIEHKDACMVPSDAGPCRAAFSMYYFDRSTSSCKSFIYGGCQGNDNRYGTLDECMARCTGVDGEQGQHNGHNRMTPGFFLVASLVVISALILVGLILFTFRCSRLQRGHRRLSDKEDLLPYEELFEEQLPEEALPKVGTAP